VSDEQIVDQPEEERPIVLEDQITKPAEFNPTPADEPVDLTQAEWASIEELPSGFAHEPAPEHPAQETGALGDLLAGIAADTAVPVSEQIVDLSVPVPEAEAAPLREMVGDFTPNMNVNDDQGILTVLTDEQLAKFSRDNPSVLLSNFSADELDVMYDQIERQVANAQEAREELVKNGGGAGLYAGRTDDGEVIYITANEGKAMGAIEDYRKTTAPFRNNADLFGDDDSEWTNLPKVGDTPIAPGRLDHEKSKDPVMRIRGRLGMAVEYTNPFWASGLHMVIEGAGALEELSLDQKILTEKAEMGRDSSGYVYSASALYLNRPVVDFALSQVRSTTIGTTDPQVLKSLLLITDIDPLALAMASANMPNGFLLERPCLEQVGGCGFVTKRQVNLRRMLMVRRSKLSDDQAQFMSKRAGTVDIKTVLGYQAKMRPEISRIVNLKGGLILRFKVPTIAEYERIASAWLDYMDQQSRKVAASNANQQEREAFLLKASRVSVLMAYGHWIEAVLETDPDDLAAEPKVMIERSGEEGSPEQYQSDVQMQRLLVSLAVDQELSDQIIEELSEFINQMTMSTPVIPKMKCPNCGKQMQGDDASKHPHLVNLNAVEVFFTLLRLRMQKLSS
jgi:hypothetical protein